MFFTPSLAAENLFLRKQLACYIERKVKPRRLDDAARIALVVLARVVEWRQLLVVVKPATLVRWHRQGFRLFWRWKSRRSGRPRRPVHLQRLIAEMARANRTWGEERIAAELLGEAGHRRLAADGQAIHAAANPHEARFSFANVEYVCPQPRHRDPRLRFLRHGHGTFRLVFVFLVMEIGTRRILHWNLTEHPTAEWTTQQFRSVVTGDEPYRLVLHDRDAVFASDVDDALRSMNLRVLQTPAHVPQANAFCERLIGTARRECLDHVIALNERHLRKILADWVRHYNRGRPHAALGPGIPDPSGLTVPQPVGHQIPRGQRVVATPILGGLHHEYRLESVAA